MSEVATIQSIRPDSLVNFVSVTVISNPSEPTPVTQVVSDTTSQTNYGIQSIDIESLLATNDDAELLADYLLRPDPNFWFTGLSVNMTRLTEAQRDLIATLDIGSFVAVVKTQKYGTPATVTKRLYIEGIKHRLTTSNHIVELYFSPVGFTQPWNTVTATLQWEDVATGLSWTNLIWTEL